MKNFKYLYEVSCAAVLVVLVGCERSEPALIEHEETPKPQVEINIGPSLVIPKITLVNQAAQTIPVKQIAINTLSVPQIRPQTTPFKIRRCINMGNALEAPNEGDWGYRITGRDLQAIANAGFDTVRIPIRWDAHTAHRAPFAIDAPFMSRVKNIVSNAQAAGLGVIIDMHHYQDLMARPRRQEARFLAMWDQIARTFSGAPDTVYFEVLNEPTLELSSAQINALYAKALPITRASNPTRKVILGGNSWNSLETLDNVIWPLNDGKRDANLVATFHDYGPHKFTHQGAEWMEPVMPMGRKWGSAADIAELNSTYADATAFKAKTGLPILVGEFGVIDKVSQTERNRWTKSRRKAMEGSGLAWCAWDFAGAFKTYDTDKKRWLPGAQDALFGP